MNNPFPVLMSLGGLAVLFAAPGVPYEGEIAGTDLFIPYDEVDAHLDRLPADRDAGRVLYCMSGRMSAIAAEILTSHGYTNLLHVPAPPPFRQPPGRSPGPR